MRFKKTVIGLLAVVMILSILPLGATASASNQPEVKVFYDGNRLRFSIPPVIEQGTTLVQFRPIFEALDFEVGWIHEEQRVTGVKGDLEISMVLGDKRVVVTEDGRRRNINLEVEPRTINGHTMVPLRFLSEVSGKYVEWNGVDREITIDTGYTEYRQHDPYARDSFVPLEDAPDLLRIDPDFYQDGQYFYVTWYESTRFGDFEGFDFYVSVARGNNWVVQNKRFHGVTAPRGTKFDIQFLDGAYYVKDANSIKEIRPTHEGKDTMRYMANGLPNHNGTDWMKPILIDGEVGILYGSEVRVPNHPSVSYLRIYYNDPEEKGYAYTNRFYSIKDVYGILKGLKGDVVLTYSPKRDLVYILEQTGYRQLNTLTGDLIYDKEGKDLVVKYHPEIANSGNRIIISNKNIHLLYKINREDKYKFADILYTMLVTNHSNTQITQNDLNARFLAYDKNVDALKFTQFYNHSRKPAVNMVEYRKP